MSRPRLVLELPGWCFSAVLPDHLAVTAATHPDNTLALAEKELLAHGLAFPVGARVSLLVLTSDPTHNRKNGDPT